MVLFLDTNLSFKRLTAKNFLKLRLETGIADGKIRYRNGKVIHPFQLPNYFLLQILPLIRLFCN